VYYLYFFMTFSLYGLSFGLERKFFEDFPKKIWEFLFGFVILGGPIVFFFELFYLFG
jgi:hypothetical protein